jgi:NADH-quinone oxidoreductase subunit L
VGSAVGGFLSIPHYLEPMLRLPDIRPGIAALHTSVVAMSIAIAAIGLVAAWYFFGDLRRAEAWRARFGGLHRLLSGKYFVDEIYDRLLTRPLTWVSRAVFLNLGDRVLIDGTLNGMASFARRTAGALGRVQTGNLQLYLLLALAGLAAAIWWSATRV